MRRDRVKCRTDWFRVLADLQYAGRSNYDVAAFIDVPLGTVRGWKEGSEPRHDDGQRLLELWQMVTAYGYEDRPCVRG